MTVVAFPSIERPFPHVLEPLPEESLLGFLFRLDAANGWPSGTVATFLCTHRTGWRQASAAMWASGTIWDLRRLAGLVEQPYEAIAALTYLPDIRAAAADPDLTIHALGDRGRLVFCPACFASSGVIPRSCLLPLLRACPHHAVRLVPLCHHRGPAPIALDAPGAAIRCAGCRRVLAPAVGEPLPAVELAHQLDVWRAWAFLLGWRGDDIRGRGYRTIRSVARHYPLRNLGAAPSFEHLVEVFLALQIEPELVAQLEERPARPCPNAACPRYVAPGPDDPLVRGRPVERHCHECGARFVGRRLLLCFDADHGGDRPSAHSVRRAQRRLRRWRAALAEACREDILTGRRITVTGTFRRAGIPHNANLRASRLGLVTLVRDAARRQRLLERGEPAEFSTVTMAEYRVIRDLAHDARWLQLLQVARLGRIEPNAATPPLPLFGSSTRRDPVYGLLDSLFEPAWARRNQLDPSMLRERIERVARHQTWSTRLLSDHWVDGFYRRCEVGDCDGVVPRNAYPQRTYPEQLRPAVRDFVLGEWSPDWMPHLLDGFRATPPAPSPFA